MECYDATHQMYITLPIYADWYNPHSPQNFYTTIKSVLSLKSIYKKLTKKTDYNITNCGDYLLIDTQQDGVEYSFGIFKYDKNAYKEAKAYDYVITSFICFAKRSDTATERLQLYFPFWAIGKRNVLLNLAEEYQCSMSIDELYDYYVKHGYDINRDGNTLSVEYARYRYYTRENGELYIEKSNPYISHFRVIYQSESIIKFEEIVDA